MWLGARPTTLLAIGGHLSRVTALALADGRRIVVKVRPFQACLAGWAYVQQHLWCLGVACPEPLVGPVPRRAGAGLAVNAKALVDGGQMLAPDIEMPSARTRRLLARLIRLAPSAAELVSLAPAPPWTTWDHSGRASGRVPTTVPMISTP